MHDRKDPIDRIIAVSESESFNRFWYRGELLLGLGAKFGGVMMTGYGLWEKDVLNVVIGVTSMITGNAVQRDATAQLAELQASSESPGY